MSDWISTLTQVGKTASSIVIGGGILAFILKTVAIDFLRERQRLSQERWTIKRKACLEALEVVDAQMACMQWQVNGSPVGTQKSTFDIAKARAVQNTLIITCDSADVANLYMRALGVRAPDEAPYSVSADTIHDLRLAIRAELKFGPHFDFDRRKAWIASLAGASDTDSPSNDRSNPPGGLLRSAPL